MSPASAKPEPLTGISSMATRHLLAELAAEYARSTGRPVSLVSDGGVDVARRVRGGEAFDVVFLASDALAQLAAAGLVEPDTQTPVVRSEIAIGVRTGTPHPDISNEAAVRDAVVNARTIGYSTGPSGTHLAKLFARWGIAEAVASRIVTPAPATPVGALVASGEIDLGFQQLSEMTGLPGVDVVGLLPPEVQLATIFSGAVAASSARGTQAKALLAWLASPATADVKRRHGMEPA
jgi:molybdate transport system substrate-binding protein